MTDTKIASTNSPSDTVAVWAVFAPVLIAFPVLGTMAGLALLVPGQSLIVYVVQLLFLITGFWGILSVWLLAQVASRSEVVDAPLPDGRMRVLVIGIYASVWTFFYVIAAFASF